MRLGAAAVGTAVPGGTSIPRHKEIKEKEKYETNILHLQMVPMVHLVSYTQSNIVHRQNPASRPEYREDRCCLVTGGTLAR